tara:strand:- start:70 stop:972 length:903 start_codon:yes stop_codon:yes gene_type:complete
MPAFLTGLIASLLLILNTLIWAPLLIGLALLKLLLPIPVVRTTLSWLVDGCASRWIACNSGWMKLTQAMDWQIERPDKLTPQGWYFVVSNHQSWVDILVLQHCLNGHIPLLKFFLKQELIWVPIMGIAWWALDFPFMKRYSKAYLARHPEKRGQDLNTTRKSCEKFQHKPTSVMNFLEGTRFNQEKHALQRPSYRHLLQPRAGGMAFAMSVMGDNFHSLVDVTIHYPDGVPTFWSFLSGKMRRCQVLIQQKDIPAELSQGDYQNDIDFRNRFQQWVHELWLDKDDTLERLSRSASTSQAE